MNFASHTIRLVLWLVSTLLISVMAATPQDTAQLEDRELKPRPVPDKLGTTAPPAIPRGYALVVGIGKYEKLDPQDYLKFSESDAEAMYRVLISQQGGAFPAENVHKLIGPRATLENLRHELEEWLPFVTKESDRVVRLLCGTRFRQEWHRIYRSLGCGSDQARSNCIPNEHARRYTRPKGEGALEGTADGCLPLRKDYT